MNIHDTLRYFIELKRENADKGDFIAAYLTAEVCISLTALANYVLNRDIEETNDEQV